MPYMRAAAIAAALVVASCASTEDAESVYFNPVLAADFPDPAVVRARDGWFYAYATQGVRDGRMLNIQVARSADLVSWQHLGDALPEKPAWGLSKQNFWAPHVIYDAAGERYFLYYSAEPDGARGKCLGVATAESARGPFRDVGKPLVCGQGIEHIDPMAFDDPATGKRLLFWGSGKLPIRSRELARDRTRFAEDSESRDILFPDAAPYRSLVEAPWVIFRDGYYYLFYSGDRCCVGEPRYSVMVARARDPFGPYEHLQDGRGRSVILERDGWWLNTGHASVVLDASGRHWLVYHATDATQWHYEHRAHGRLGARVLMLDALEWRDGWPRVPGSRPSSGPRPAPSAGPTPPPRPSGTKESAPP